MHQEREIVERRLQRVRREYIRPVIWSPRVPFRAEMWSVPDEPDGTVGEPVAVDVARAASYEPVTPGTTWGRPWGTAWFRASGEVPHTWAGQAVEAILNLGFNDTAPGFMAEGLIWRQEPDGRWVPDRGLHPANHIVRVSDRVAGGESVSFLIEAAANPLMWGLDSVSNSDRDTAGGQPIYAIAALDLAVVNLDVWSLHHDLRALIGLMAELPLDGSRRWEILTAIERSLDALDLGDVIATAGSARAELAGVLARPAVPSAHRITAVGHAHIDTAWLWPRRETKRKVARTFSNVLKLIDAEPEFVFACSQAAQYQWMIDHYPSVFDGIRKAVAAGQWVPVGGMWVEADGNVPGGESIARQLLIGQRFFAEHFGSICSEVWIPDVFGYPASFPQLFRLGGCDRFLTQKMSWNRTNRFPHHTFWWEGVDGSRVFTHFPSADTYGSAVEPAELARAERQFAEKGHATRSLLPFGFGDGGGGPNRDMFERIRRLRDLEGLPRIELDSPAAFFEAARAEYPDAPVWVGELYLEMHRGTYTSQARTKQGNRRCETLLREAELWSVLAYGGRPADGYPAAALDRIWKEVLLLQFHDILPGSSIGWVHREAEESYARMIGELEDLIATALAVVSDGPMLANPAPHDRDEVVVTAPPDPAPVRRGAEIETQDMSDGQIAYRVAIPALGLAPATPRPVTEAARVRVSERVLDNGMLRVTLGDDGCVSSLRHVESDREVIAPDARGALFQLHPDVPLEYDAWDIESYYRNRVTDIDAVSSIDVLDDGPLVGRIRVRRSFGDSSLSQTYELRALSRRLDIVVELDWQERNQLLKLSWPVDVHANDVVRHIQYGHVRTPIHTNTTWDAARFEVCAHHWIDVGEPGFGVALLNDSRYGYDITRTRTADGTPSTTMRLTVVKGAVYPDPRADLGEHRFTCAVLPHDGPFRRSGIITEGYRLNHPPRLVTHGTAGPSAASPPAPVVAVDSAAIVVEAVKAAEDGSGDVVVRCYESYGGRVTATVRFVRPVAEVRLTDLLEEDPPPEPAPDLERIDEHSVRLSLRPFQIATLRVRPA